MTKRPTISVKDQVTVAIRQATGDGIKCPWCYEELKADEPRILEHMVPRAWSEDDGITNLGWIHKWCAERKTYGNKATCADGDIHKIAKAKRLAKANAEHQAVLARVMERPAGKIRSRGFDKRLRKKMNGSVEKRT